VNLTPSQRELSSKMSYVVAEALKKAVDPESFRREMRAILKEKLREGFRTWKHGTCAAHEEDQLCCLDEGHAMFERLLDHLIDGGEHHDDIRCREILREQVRELKARLEGGP
jgi:hypothetical protein